MSCPGCGVRSSAGTLTLTFGISGLASTAFQPTLGSGAVELGACFVAAIGSSGGLVNECSFGTTGGANEVTGDGRSFGDPDCTLSMNFWSGDKGALGAAAGAAACAGVVACAEPTAAAAAAAVAVTGA